MTDQIVWKQDALVRKDPTEGQGATCLSCALFSLLLRMSQSMCFTVTLVTTTDSQMLSRNSTKYSVARVPYEL